MHIPIDAMVTYKRVPDVDEAGQKADALSQTPAGWLCFADIRDEQKSLSGIDTKFVVPLMILTLDRTSSIVGQ